MVVGHYDRKFIEGKKVQYITPDGNKITMEVGDFSLTPVEVIDVMKKGDPLDTARVKLKKKKPYTQQGFVISSENEDYELWCHSENQMSVRGLEKLADEIKDSDVEFEQAIDILNRGVMYREN